ncbi:hypothetical protein OIO90_001030 [Microbotryomycetes sp. JL221]|nr:hypothetical protein OIO90_001030 [Microbotryomycetes sp. JL221]
MNRPRNSRLGDDFDRFEELLSSPTSSTASFHSADGEDQELNAQQSSTLADSTEASESAANDKHQEVKKALEDDDDDEATVWWDAAELKDILSSASELKAAGNALFGQGRWEMAMTTYRDGLNQLPARSQLPTGSKGKQKETDGPTDDTIGSTRTADQGTAANQLATVDVQSDSEARQITELRSVLYANVAACCLKLERWKDAVEACNAALDDNPSYVKALHRRAMANEQIKSWGSLTSALEDYKTLEKLEDVTPAQRSAIKAAQTRLPPLIAEQQEKEKDEVLGKLKDLGNTVLGKFGLSTDNFKFVEQPGGGYSMNFQR